LHDPAPPAGAVPNPATSWKPKHIPALDGLRGVAVLQVCCYHLVGGSRSPHLVLRALGTLNKLGWSGVTLFFLLSGYLITQILWQSKGQPHWGRNFYARRALRIWPLYYASLGLLLLVALVQHEFVAALRNAWVPAFYLQNIGHFASYADALPVTIVIGHFWTIAVEEQFYLLWPVVILLVRTKRQAAAVCLGVFALSLLCRWVGWHGWYIGSYDSLAGRAGELALGAWLAMVDRETLWPRYRAYVLPVLVVALALLYGFSVQTGFQLLDQPSTTVGLAAMTVAMLCLLAASLRPGPLSSLLCFRPLRWVGKVSFGIYVFHLLFIRQYDRLARYLVGSNRGNSYFTARFLIDMGLTLCLAWASYRFYERPFLRLKRHFRPAASS
jgi:peptidoglycan/LPS O-acetylase OafA/YrhL